MTAVKTLKIISGPSNESMAQKVEDSAEGTQSFLFSTDQGMKKILGKAKKHSTTGQRYRIEGIISGLGKCFACFAFYSPEPSPEESNEIFALCESATWSPRPETALDTKVPENLSIFGANLPK